MGEEQTILAWVDKVVQYGLQKVDCQERLFPLLPDSFGSEEGTSLAELCDGKLLCAIAISVDPELAKGPTGLAVAARIAFFQSFCRKVGVPSVRIVQVPNIWPKPPKNPASLLACLGELGLVLAARPGSDVPVLDAEAAAAAVAAAAGGSEVAAGKDTEQEEQAAAQQHVIDSMAPAPSAESGPEECRRLRQREVSLPSSTPGLERTSTLTIVETRDEDEEEQQPEVAEAPPPESVTEPAAEEPEAVPEAVKAEVYKPAEEEEAAEFEADALPVLHGHLYKKSPASFRLGGWDNRFFILRDMHLHWWKRKQDAARPEAADADGGPLCKGTISLLTDPVQLEFERDSPTKFMLRPEAGSWGGENTTMAKKREKRIFYFDAQDSEHNREVWASAIHAHLQKAKQLQLPTLAVFFDETA